MILTKTITIPRLHQLSERSISKPMKPLSHILLVDDDEIFIFLTRKMLQSTGLVESISVCRSAIEAMHLLLSADDESNLPDIIFLDLNMPGMDGWEFLQHYQTYIKGMRTYPKLYVVSSSIAENDAERAMKIKGVEGYIAKPLTAEGINHMIRNATAAKGNL